MHTGAIEDASEGGSLIGEVLEGDREPRLAVLEGGSGGGDAQRADAGGGCIGQSCPRSMKRGIRHGDESEAQSRDVPGLARAEQRYRVVSGALIDLRVGGECDAVSQRGVDLVADDERSRSRT